MNEIWLKDHTVSESDCNIVNLSIMPTTRLQGLTNTFRFAFSVGDNYTCGLYFKYQARQIELVTLNTTFAMF